MEAQIGDLRKSGIGIIGDVPWGTHFCQFYQTREDLLDILIPYFKAGLDNNEFCMWVTAPPLEKADAAASLLKLYPKLQEKIERGQIEFLSHDEWYLKDGLFDCTRVLTGWVKKLEAALARGCQGLRLSGNTFFLETKKEFDDFTAYEEEVNGVIGQYRMVALCTYSLEKCGAAEIIEVVANHEYALIRKEGAWTLMESSTQKRLEQQYRSLFDSLLDGFAFHKVIVDERGAPVDYVFLDINPAFEKLTGLNREEVLGKRVTEVLPGIEKDPADWIGRYGKVALTGREERFESYSAALNRWFAVKAYSDRRGFFAALFEDVTERKEAEEVLKRDKEAVERLVQERTRQLLDSRQELERSRRLSDIGTLAATVAHELRNPLTAIGIAAHNIKRKGEGGDLEKQLVTIAVKIEESARIIDNLLFYSKIKPPQFEDCRLAEIIEECAEMARKYSRKELCVVRNLEAIRRLSIAADAVQVREVFNNVLGNAVDALPDTGGRIQIAAEAEPHFVKVNVKDNGGGIKKEIIDRIFDPFFTTKAKGTGLGLAVCWQIISMHQGSIKAESELGKGTSIIISLPHKVR